MKYRVKFYAEVMWKTTVEAEDEQTAEALAQEEYEQIKSLDEYEWLGESVSPVEVEEIHEPRVD